MRNKILRAAVFAVMGLTTLHAEAAIDRYRLYLAAQGAIPWQSLSPQEQDALRRYRGQWDSYSDQRQEEMRRGAQRYLQLPPQKRREVEQQRRQYQRMTPEQRRRLREEYQRERR